MKCPICEKELKIIKTDKFDTVVKRVRRCDNCGWAVPTHEQILSKNEAKKAF